MNRVRRQPAVERQTERRIARELDDLARSGGAGAVDVTEANDRALGATTSRPLAGALFDVKLGPSVFALRMRMPPFMLGITSGRDQLAVDGDRADVHEPFEGFSLQQAVEEGAVARVRLARNTAGGFERAVDDHFAIVKHVRLAAPRRQ